MNALAATLPQTRDNSSLKAGNMILRSALGMALDAIYQLDDAGTTVKDIDIRGGMPVLRIDQPPQFVQGVITVRHASGRYTERLYAAPFRGCQLEWTERSLRDA